MISDIRKKQLIAGAHIDNHINFEAFYSSLKNGEEISFFIEYLEEMERKLAITAMIATELINHSPDTEKLAQIIDAASLNSEKQL